MAKPSAESLSIAAVSIPVRPDPPRDLSRYAKQIWCEVVKTKPPEWFQSDSFPLLRAYCQAAEQHKKLGDKIKKMDMASPEYRKFLIMLTNQAKVIGELAMKMRLTQQSRYTPQAAATANKNTGKAAKRLWES